MQSVIKPFKAPTSKAPWLGKSVLENAKAASVTPAAKPKKSAK